MVVMEKIQFKYHPNVWKQDVFSSNKDGTNVICQCCGQETKYFLKHMYTSMDINAICPKCVANGKAAKKFDGGFIQDAEINKVTDMAKIDELFNKTPGYLSWQGEYWLTCCNDFCAYIGDVGTKELEEMGIADEVFEEYDKLNEYEDVRDYLVKAGSLAGYLFKCLHCGKYHLWVDAD
jgi:uncharacterized protein